MATIQVRNLPSEVHHTYRRRAAEAGMSLQEYVRAELIRGAMTRSPAEVVAAVRERIATEGSAGYLDGSSVDIVRAERNAG